MNLPRMKWTCKYLTGLNIQTLILFVLTLKFDLFPGIALNNIVVFMPQPVMIVVRYISIFICTLLFYFYQHRNLTD